MAPILIAYWGGSAHTGATYEIEVTDDNSCFTVTAYSTGNGASRKTQGQLYQDTDQTAAFSMLLKQADKKRKGRERAYTTPLNGVATSAVWVSKLLPDGSLPLHEQIWCEGRALSLLPAALHKQVATPVTAPALASSTTAPAFVAPAPATAPAPAPGSRVALCNRADEAAAEAMIISTLWVATRKMEGQRAMVHVRGGKVTMTNRTGGEIACPPHIAEVAAQLLDGTTLDGELVSLTPDGRESLYAGAAATEVVFVAFDVLSSPMLPDALQKPQNVRFNTLGRIIGILGAQSAIRLVEMAIRPDEKRALLERGKKNDWEGLVFRKYNAVYPIGRSADWVKFKLRFETLDAVVMRYQTGTGRLNTSVGAVEVGLYTTTGELVSIGEVGSGWTDAQRAELQRRCAAGETGYVIEVRTEGFSAGKKLVRPVAVGIRAAGDKAAHECQFA